MYTLLRTVPVRSLVFQQAPTLGVSLLIAETAYKFGSFVLEAVAFLLTWYVLDGLRHWITRLLKPEGS